MLKCMKGKFIFMNWCTKSTLIFSRIYLLICNTWYNSTNDTLNISLKSKETGRLGSLWSDTFWHRLGLHKTHFNSSAPGRSECHSKDVIFNIVLLIGIFRSSHDNALSWMSQDRTDDKSILVQVMAWCHQATSHYLSQCWPRSLSPYDITRPQWLNSLRPSGA